jgi:endonuclease G
MLIHSSIVNGSIARARRSRVEAASERAGCDGEPRRRLTPEQQQMRHAALVAQSGSDERAGTLLERLIGGNDLVGINYLELGVACARSVCRVHLRDASGSTVGFGTGFLVAPGVLMTNHHVIASADEARNAQAEFDYELDVRGEDKPVARFALLAEPAPIALQELDFCLVAVAPQSADRRRRLDEFGFLPLNGATGKGIVGEYLTIVQHPAGERKQVCVRENRLVKYDEGGNTVWYRTDTVAGSSGSPVFNQVWQVIAIHHSGVPRTDAQGRWLTDDGKPWDRSMDETRVAWKANEGVRISRIVEYLRSRAADHPLGAAVLQHSASMVVTPPNPREARREPTTEYEDGELRMTFPVQVAFRLSGLAAPPAPSNGGVAQVPPRNVAVAPPGDPVIPVGVEKVTVDQSTYAQRRGYDEAFLGAGKLRVPLPVVRGTSARQVLKIGRGGREQELRYWNYSVVMNRARRLAFCSAVNVDARKRPSAAGREGDRWYVDPRVPDAAQLGAEFYGAQQEFEVDRSANPFDRGHLTRRLDAQWGATPGQAKRSGDDSFHWTNCSPQHWKFNQGAKRWLGLEDYVVQGLAGASGRACILNGPVFDAPWSTAGEDGRLVVSPHGRHEPDPTFGGVPIPKLFYKVVACATADAELAVAAFVMSQEDLLRTEERMRGMRPAAPEEEERLSAAEARLFQVSVADVAALTGLDFGPLLAADTFRGADEALAVPREIRQVQEVVRLPPRAPPPPPARRRGAPRRRAEA